MLHPQVFTQSLFQLLMKRPAIGQDLVVPNLLQEGNEILKGRQMGLGYINGLILHGLM
jgi:hypothetical protein